MNMPEPKSQSEALFGMVSPDLQDRVVPFQPALITILGFWFGERILTRSGIFKAIRAWKVTTNQSQNGFRCF